MEKNISSNDNISGVDEQENDSNATNDEESNDIDDGKETDDDDDSFHELIYKQQQAFETLSSISRTLNVSPIHDR